MTLLKTVFDLEEMVSDLGGNELADLQLIVASRLMRNGVSPDHDDEWCPNAHELDEAMGDADFWEREYRAIAEVVQSALKELDASKSQNIVMRRVREDLRAASSRIAL